MIFLLPPHEGKERRQWYSLHYEPYGLRGQSIPSSRFRTAFF